MFIQLKNRVIKEAESDFSFVNYDGNQFIKHLHYKEKSVFDLGLTCGTCNFAFERIGGVDDLQEPLDIVTHLKTSIEELDENTLLKLDQIFPQGEYIVMLSRIKPQFVTPWGDNDYFYNEQSKTFGDCACSELPHFTKTQYYRDMDNDVFVGNSSYFQFYIPLAYQGWLDDKVAEEYIEGFKSNQMPTALALGYGYDFRRATGHIDDHHHCLSHYIVDGNHKIYAAARAGKEIMLISYVSKTDSAYDFEHGDNIFDVIGKH